MRKILITVTLFLLSLSLVACNNKTQNPTTTQISIETTTKKETITLEAPTGIKDENGKIVWDSVDGATGYVIKINSNEIELSSNEFPISDITIDFMYQVKAKGDGINTIDSKYSKLTVYEGKNPLEIPSEEIVIAISSDSDLRSGTTMKLEAVVSGTHFDDSVTWEVLEGSEYVTIDNKGNATVKEVDSTKLVRIQVTSNENPKFKTSKVFSIMERSELTQEMLNKVMNEKASFEGFVTVDLYTIGMFSKLYGTYTYNVKTALDGSNWYAEYENSATGTTSGMYYKNVDGMANQVGLSFMNEEYYYPMLESDGSIVSWKDSGLYNNFIGLKASDFYFDEETWRWTYNGSDDSLKQRMTLSANPYDLTAASFSLIIEDGEIIGMYIVSEEDYTIYEGYLGIQRLIVAITASDDVDVPVIEKYSHEDIHDDLEVAINNMRSLDNYTMYVDKVIYSVYASGYQLDGFKEIITDNECQFAPYTYLYGYDDDYKEIKNRKFDYTSIYGYKLMRENFYNSYFTTKDTGCKASRAYNGSMDDAKPSFAFAPEIFRKYYFDEEDGTTTYYVDTLMSGVSTTFYYGVGNDENLYGLFGTESPGKDAFTPYITVKDGYIVKSGFYFNISYMYGIYEIEYFDFNVSEIENSAEFAIRELPKSWSELTIEVQDSEEEDSGETSTNALEYLKKLFKDDSIGDEMPFFNDCLGDTYGFGMTQIHTPAGSNVGKSSITFYYDVPLDQDWTINSSLKKIEDYLISLGFTKNNHGEFFKGKIACQPYDSSLDLLVYVWVNN